MWSEDNSWLLCLDLPQLNTESLAAPETPRGRETQDLKGPLAGDLRTPVHQIALANRQRGI